MVIINSPIINCMRATYFSKILKYYQFLKSFWGTIMYFWFDKAALKYQYPFSNVWQWMPHYFASNMLWLLLKEILKRWHFHFEFWIYSSSRVQH